MVVTNPPFDQRTAIMERLNALGLPYCMLMPMSTLETDARQAALSEGHPLTLCVLARRARFLTSDGAIIRGGSARSLARWVASCSRRISTASIGGRYGHPLE
jgi:hypothetical protein